MNSVNTCKNGRVIVPVSLFPVLFIVPNMIVNNAVRYSASQIALISKLNLKEGSEILGIRMRVDTYKSRFAKL
jgi:hypothetical protein